MSDNRKILYTAGCHGNFIKYLFDCHDAKEILPTPFNENGNAHDHSLENNNRNFDLCNKKDFGLELKFKGKKYTIVWEGFDSFFYAMSSYTDRGGHLIQSGIQLVEHDLKQYEETYGVEVNISKILREHFNYDIDSNGQPPRAVLRNYFLLSFYTHFNHVLWLRNNELQHMESQKIKLLDILDANTLKSVLHDIFGYALDIDSVHKSFMTKNAPYQQLQLVKSVLTDVALKKDCREQIAKLNIISEAYILFCLDIKNFDIPFHIGNDFFRSTKDIAEYIDHFPEYMKNPNNIFYKEHKHYQRKAIK